MLLKYCYYKYVSQGQTVEIQGFTRISWALYEPCLDHKFTNLQTQNTAVTHVDTSMW